MRSKDKTKFEKCIRFINDYYKENGYAPNVREIGEDIGLTSAMVCAYLKEMRQKELLNYEDGERRSIETDSIKKMQGSIRRIPVVGSIACGTPILAEENIERYLTISSRVLDSGDYYILQAKGSSMIEVGIDDGDYVLVKQQNYADIGQIVVALINDETTLKKYYLDEKAKCIILRPANKTMQDIRVKDCVIQGVVAKVSKNLF